MAEAAAVGDFGVGNFGEEFGRDPLNFAGPGAFGGIGEGGCFAVEGGEFIVNFAKGGVGESGADFAGVLEVALLVVEADEEGAEMGAGAGGWGVAADDKFLAVVTFDFDPGFSAFLLIGGVELF